MLKNKLFKVFEGKNVLVTGNTGFKGSWLSLWLNLLGAKVIGISNNFSTKPQNFNICKLYDIIDHHELDIRDDQKLCKFITQKQPEKEPPPVDSSPPPEPPEAPEVPTDAIPNIPKDEEIECPPPNALRVGDVAQNKRERVSGYEVQNGICVTLYEDIPFIDQYLPDTQTVSTTAAIATTAAASALLAKPLADLLLRAFKPVINKVIGKAKKMLGKKPPRLSTKDRRAQQRISSHALRKLKGKE